MATKDKGKPYKVKRNSASPEQTGRLSDSEHDSSCDEMDLEDELHPIGHYIDDRKEMINQIFKVIRGARLKSMMTSQLKNIDLVTLKKLCLEQLEGMSRRRIICVLNGQELAESSDTSDEDHEPDGSIDSNAAFQGKLQSGISTIDTSPRVEAESIMLNCDSKKSKSLLELLELEMRARALKSLLNHSHSGDGDQSTATHNEDEDKGGRPLQLRDESTLNSDLNPNVKTCRQINDLEAGADGSITKEVAEKRSEISEKTDADSKSVTKAALNNDETGGKAARGNEDSSDSGRINQKKQLNKSCSSEKVAEPQWPSVSNQTHVGSLKQKRPHRQTEDSASHLKYDSLSSDESDADFECPDSRLEEKGCLSDTDFSEGTSRARSSSVKKPKTANDEEPGEAFFRAEQSDLELKNHQRQKRLQRITAFKAKTGIEKSDDFYSSFNEEKSLERQLKKQLDPPCSMNSKSSNDATKTKRHKKKPKHHHIKEGVGYWAKVCQNEAGYSAGSDTRIPDMKRTIDPVVEQEEVSRHDEEARCVTWADRWLQNKNVKKVVQDSKMLSKVRSNIKVKLKPAETEAPAESAPLPNIIGSMEEYAQIVGKSVQMIEASRVDPDKCESNSSEEEEEADPLWKTILKK